MGCSATPYIEKRVELQMLTTVNKGFDAILDSIVLSEKKSDYYKDRLLFNITVNHVQNDSIFEISISPNINNTVVINNDSNYGYLFSKGHYFIVNGIQVSLFAKTHKSKKFKYLEYNPDYLTEVKKGEVDKYHLLYFTDDRCSVWNYLYNGNNFTFIGNGSEMLNGGK